MNELTPKDTGLRQRPVANHNVYEVIIRLKDGTDIHVPGSMVTAASVGIETTGEHADYPGLLHHATEFLQVSLEMRAPAKGAWFARLRGVTDARALPEPEDVVEGEVVE
jgi:hypothetical protein